MWRELFGLEKKPNNLVELITPRRTFADVILPEETRQQLFEALTQIDKHRLIFAQWGLGERHPTGLGLAFNFAGPPGTGKTICAEAIASALGRKLLRVRYAELESCWAGETGKNIRNVFREAKTQDAVLFFDEADSVAARRFSSVSIGYEREANQAVNILLKELEEHEGVVIFATNMASNFDPAFERRIRTHILFRIPSIPERERIWKVQVHPSKTPLADDVDFRDLAERYEVAGGDIRNAVLKAAQMAAAEEGADEGKLIHQRHLIAAMDQVLTAKQVMRQNAVDPLHSVFPWQEAVDAAEKRLAGLDEDLNACRTELGLLADGQVDLSRRIDDRVEPLAARVDELSTSLAGLHTETSALRESVDNLRAEVERAETRQASAIQAWQGEHTSGLKALGERLESYEARLARVTLIPLPRAAAALMALLLGAGLLVLGGFVLPF